MHPLRLRGPHEAALPFRLTLASVANVEMAYQVATEIITTNPISPMSAANSITVRPYRHVYFGGCKPDEETH